MVNKDNIKKEDRFYVTTPIYYTNGPVHAGGAYTTIAADILARWNRLKGKEVFFLTGTDEHGKKIQEAAEEKGVEPKKFVDDIVAGWKKAFQLLNISNDNFIRTTEEGHVKEVQKLLQDLYDKGLIYKGSYESYYCIGCEQYLTEKDLEDGKCPAHNRVPELRNEEAYMFKLSKFQDELLELIESGRYCILPEIRRKEIINFIKDGLEDVSVSRLKENVYWGIDLPFDDNHCTWVWPDALWNYLTGLKGEGVFDKFWPPNVQLMAKDIFRVHATIWPALLLGAGCELPSTLFIHGFFTVNGRKMSKSLGNVIDPVELTNKYGSDSLRYFLMRNIPFGYDGDISEKALVDRHNYELANKLGNLVSRVSSLAEKYGLEKNTKDTDLSMKVERVEEFMNNYQFDKVLNEIFSIVDDCNEYIDEKKPWEDGNKKVLYIVASKIKVAAILLWPFMPNSSEEIARTFNFEIKLENLKKPLEISQVKKAKILFEKKEFSEDSGKIERKKNGEEKDSKDKGEGVVDFKSWQKLDLRVAKIVEVEDVENSEKLFKLVVDIGREKRQLVAGLKESYDIEELKGKKCIVFVNLEPAEIMGIKSEGMILAAGKNSRLLEPDEGIGLGSKIE